MNNSQEEVNKRPLFILVISLILLVIFAVIIGFVGIKLGNTLQESLSSSKSDLTSISTKCSNEGGHWIENTKECEKVSEPFCRSVGGVFDACASPCRNTAGEVMCIQMCVQVCTFK